MLSITEAILSGSRSHPGMEKGQETEAGCLGGSTLGYGGRPQQGLGPGWPVTYLVEAVRVPRLPREGRRTSRDNSGDFGRARLAQECQELNAMGYRTGRSSRKVAEGNPAGLKHPVSCSGVQIHLRDGGGSSQGVK